jgi:hypothetical protein
VQKQICEVHCHDVCVKRCDPVTECCHKEVCCQVSKCIEECCTKQVCVPCCKEVMETCYKTCTKRICEPCTTMKCVTKRIVECVEEPYTPIFNGSLRNLFSGFGRNACNDSCGDGCTTHGKSGDCCDPCFDPCACKTFHLTDRLRSHRNDCCDPCATDKGCGNSCAPCPTRKVWKVRCVTEQVPCTTYVTRCVTEQVPYTVCKKVRYTEVRNVPYTVRRNVRGAYVDDKGGTYECDGPGRHFKEGAVARKQVPYSVTRMVTTYEKKTVSRTVSRCARGAYVDEKGEHHGCDGPGRRFEEGANYKVATTYTTTRMVQEHCVKKVPYTVYENVIEKQIKKVPYQVCRMVPHTVTKKVPFEECVMEKYTVCRKVPYTECVKQCCTRRVAYTVCETVPCHVTKKVKVCVPETVCVKKARLVAETVVCDPAPACGNSCCDDCRAGFLDRLRQRCFASLCSTGCCEQNCKTGCTSECNDVCREGLFQRLFRNRFACETGCCDGGCGTTTSAAPATTTPGEPIAPPKKLPQN